MKNLFGILFVSVFALSACGGLPSPIEGKTNSEIVQEALVNVSEIKSGSYKISLEGEVKPPDILADRGEEEIGLGIFAEGLYDVRDEEAQSFSMDLKLEMTLEDDKKELVTGELLMKNKDFLFKLNSATDFSGSLPSFLVEPYFGQWFSLGLEEEISTSSILIGTAQSDEVRALYKEVALFKNVKFKGEEGDAYKFEVELDKIAFREFLDKNAELQGEEFDQISSDAFDELMESVDLEGEIWIDKETMTVKKLAGELKIDSSDGFEAKFDFVEEFGNFNEEVEILMPEEVEDLNLGALLGLENAFDL